MVITCAAKTHVGMVRTSNQDSILCAPDSGLFIVADGLGGHNGGEVASGMAIEQLSQSIPAIDSNTADFAIPLRGCVEKASQQIYDFGLKKTELQGMGTTLTACCIRGNTLTIAQVGDSRCYLVRPPHIWQLTEDHSLVQEQVRAGVLSLEKARTHQFKNVITRSLGHEPTVSVDTFMRPVAKDDVYLLCSDGLTLHVRDEEIQELVAKHSRKWDDAIDGLIDLANLRGGDDNCSVVIFSIDAI